MSAHRDAPLLPLLPKPARTRDQAWLLTFTDLVCLMLTFFVMLYAMAEPDKRSLQALVQTIGGDRSPTGKPETAPAGAALNIAGIDRGQAIDLGYLGRVLEAQVRAYPELSGILLTRRDDTLVAALPAETLFEPGSDRVTAEGRAALFALGGVVANIGNAVETVGHTDPTPIATPGFPSNWELSLARARAVAAALRAAGYPRDITVRGQADGAYAEVPAWLPAAERQRAARRVDIVIRDHRSGR
ncbi:MAG TPA: flagellar motor protein MotB [Azospirillaceae bacterium]|nr:flagellar motor protein MotB [Azospirillaceae bacterium]